MNLDTSVSGTDFNRGIRTSCAAILNAKDIVFLSFESSEEE